MKGHDFGFFIGLKIHIPRKKEIFFYFTMILIDQRIMHSVRPPTGCRKGMREREDLGKGSRR